MDIKNFNEAEKSILIYAWERENSRNYLSIMSIHNETKIEISEIEKIMDKFVKDGIAEAKGERTQSGQTTSTYDFKYGIHEGNIVTLNSDPDWDENPMALNLR